MYTGTIYNSVTGRIVSSCRSTQESDIALQCTTNPDYRAFMGEELSGLKYYFVDDQPVLRPLMKDLAINGVLIDAESDEDIEIAMNVGDTLSVTGIVDGTELFYPGSRIVVDDGFFEWSTDDAGEYRFMLNVGLYKGVNIYASFA
jgi:hypothetical protein